MVCHGDPNLVRASLDATQSIYIDQAQLTETAHRDAVCSGCHVDFAFKTPHTNAADDQTWRVVAKSECKTCHPDQFLAVSKGTHSGSLRPGETQEARVAERVAAGKPAETPLCGDCHGSHDIAYIDVERWETSGTPEAVAAAKAGAAALHAKGMEMCGQCHDDASATYDDYYHGAAFRRGALDAPACWDCHGAHQMLPADHRESPVNPKNLEKTCGACHDDVDADYIEYAKLIHRRAEVEAEVPLFAFFDSTRTTIRGAIQTVASWFKSED